MTTQEIAREAGLQGPDAAAGPATPEALWLVRELCAQLREEGLRWCHWKSNDMLARSASGENDLDLLVHRYDAQRFAEVMDRLGFRRALAPGGREHPGVSHHYALDVPSGRFVHVHAHVLLVLGDDTTKNVRLPIEAAYLASCHDDDLFPVPAPEIELAVFVLRMMLKHGTWDAVAVGKGTIGSAERRELDWLLERSDPHTLEAVVSEHLPSVGTALWSECLRAVQDGGTVRRLLLGRRVLRALRAHARRTWWHDLTLRVLRRFTWGSRRYLLRKPTRKKLDRAGVTIAIVGGDGAGKSTAVEGTAAWLGGPLAVRRSHLGKPPPSLLTLAVKGPMYVARRAGLLPSTYASVDPRSARPEDFPGNAWALWHLFTARDRLREYRRVRRFADNGGVVVSDRWPLRQISLMDGPRTTWILRDPDRFSATALRLARAEARIYDRIAAPDMLFVLRIDPEVAVARRADEESGYVRARNTEVRDVDWSGTAATVVDATLPPETVQATIRQAVWEQL